MMVWSLSKLQTFEKCPLKYKYKYIDKIPDGPSGPAAARGTMLHAAMEAHIVTGDALPAELSMYTGFLGSLKSQEGQVLPEAKLGMKIDWSPCAYDDPDVWWRGILDLLVVSATQGVVYDWKTGKIYPDHDDQKDIYSTATLSKYPHLYEVRAIHVYLDIGKNKEKTTHRNQVADVQKRFEHRVHMMECCVEFIPKPQFLCRYCGYSRVNGGKCQF